MEPSVNNEVTPLLSAIVSDVVGTGSGSASSPSRPATEASPLLDTADSIFTSAIINGAVNYFAGGGSSSSAAAASTSSPSSSSSGLFGGLSQAFGSVSNLFGKRRR